MMKGGSVKVAGEAQPPDLLVNLQSASRTIFVLYFTTSIVIREREKLLCANDTIDRNW